jgi:hypothetical protein
MSIACAQLPKLRSVYPIAFMQTIDVTRRERLAQLATRYPKLADLNEALGFERTDATLSQIRTQAPHSKTGKPRTMGDDLARRIEERLGLERGWMDTPVSIYDRDETATLLHEVMESLPKDQWPTALRLLSALKKPEANGTHG